MTTHLRVAAAITTALLLAGCAATTPNVKPTATTAAVTQNPACLSQTGSRIPGDRGDCQAFGRSYSGEDIDRTGKVNAGDALQLLDPSITVHH
jgi:outer membrane murein-binding lipoprotein Lpp